MKECRIILTPEDLHYNPCGDIIFPSVLEVPEKLRDGVKANYLMYYAPHDPPGGICLALADEPLGPWRECPENPLISNVWGGFYSVSHVSSPHALWVPEEEAVYLYYHGENSTTRLAYSRDGIHFEYGGIAADESMYSGASGVSYSRVFRYEHCPPYRYLMLFSGYRSVSQSRTIYAGWSKDGKSWNLSDRELVAVPPEYAACSPTIWEEPGRPLKLVWHFDTPKPARTDRFNCTSDLMAGDYVPERGEVSHPEILLSHLRPGGRYDRVSDPCFLRTDGKSYLYFSIGSRLAQAVAAVEL